MYLYCTLLESQNLLKRRWIVLWLTLIGVVLVKVMSQVGVKRGRLVDVLVSKYINWQHEHILGGTNKQRSSYDQMNLMQFIQGFTKTILEEPDKSNREKMLVNLSELMQKNDFTSEGHIPRNMLHKTKHGIKFRMVKYDGSADFFSAWFMSI